MPVDLPSLLPETSMLERAWETLLLEIVESIALPESHYDRINNHYEAVSGVLANPHDAGLRDGLIFPQGSFLTRTVVRAVDDNDVDVDAMLFFAAGSPYAPRELLDRVHTELAARARTQGEVERRKRCVTVFYADEQVPAHVDVTPAVPTIGNACGDGHGSLEVPDYPTGCWHPSNPRDYAAWFQAVSETPIRLLRRALATAEARKDLATEPLPSHDAVNAFDPLRAVVKLMKRHRDLFARRSKHAPISVILTTLAAKAFRDVAAESLRQPLTAYEAMRRIVARMPHAFDPPQAPGHWLLANPRRREENFAERWNREPAYAEAFQVWHADFAAAVALGLHEFTERAQFETALSRTFGDDVRRKTSQHLTEAARTGRALPGLTTAAANRVRQAETASAALIGLSRATPSRVADPEPLDRLG